MKYALVVARTPEELVKEINKEIELGWQPLGGVCVHDQGANVKYVQSMIFEETEDKKVLNG